MRLSSTLSRAATSSAGDIDALPPFASSCCLMVLSTCFRVMSLEPTLAATSSADLSDALLHDASSSEAKRTTPAGLRKRDTVVLAGENDLTDNDLPVLNCRFAFIVIFSSEVRSNV